MQLLDELIAGCVAKNQRQQKIFYERYFGYGLKIVFRYIYRYDKAIDTLNDGFVKIFNKLYTFRCEQASNLEYLLMGWMKTIIINTAIDRLRNDHFLPEIGLDSEEYRAEDRTAAADQSLLYEDIIRQIKRLPPAYRTVFNMYVIDGYTHQQIATQLNIAVGTSKSNLSKARVLLQSYVKTSEQPAKCCV